MKKDIRLAICLIGILLLGILCVYRLLADKEIEDEKENSVSGEVTGGVLDDNPVKEVTYNIDGENINLHKISYYKVSLSDLSITDDKIILPVGLEINPKLICEYVLYSLEDEGIETDITDIKINGNLCIVDMNKSIYDISEKNPQLEERILDVISMSILDNCQNIKKVTFTMGGGNFASPNIKIEKDQVYKYN